MLERKFICPFQRMKVWFDSSAPHSQHSRQATVERYQGLTALFEFSPQARKEIFLVSKDPEARGPSLSLPIL